MKIKNDQDKSLFFWVEIDFWEARLKMPSALPDNDNQFQIVLTQNQSSTEQIQINLTTQMDYSNVEQLVFQICTISQPQMEEDLEFIRPLGQGASATIGLYRDKDLSELSYYAVKSYKFSKINHLKGYQKFIRNEAALLRQPSFCENVISMFKMYSSADSIHIVTEYAIGGNLREYIVNSKYISEAEIRYIMQQIILTIDLLHRQNILHRDIKVDNIFACRTCDQQQLNVKCGTPGFMDPDVLKGNKFNFKSDIFGLGCLFYNLITGKLLFSGKNIQAILYKNKNSDPTSLIDSNCGQVSDECKDLLKMMINKDSSLRPTAEECLYHSWFEVDHKSIQNLFYINRRASGPISNLSNLNIEQNDDNISMIMGPKYFVNERKVDKSQKKSCINTPMNNRSGSPSFRLNYDSTLSKGYITQKAIGTKQNQGGFSLYLQNLHQPQLRKKSNLGLKDNSVRGKKQPNVLEEIKDEAESEYELSNQSKLHEDEDAVEDKLLHRNCIDDFQLQKRTLCLLNKRRLIYPLIQ